ncbi:MAG: tRNA uridine-5-carboxymethylaminomethyl(34) synthesis enzyme MnmG, partial [Bacilli bacterium]
LLLRHDNADIRLTEIGYNIGLATEERYQHYQDKMSAIKRTMDILKTSYVGVKKDINDYLLSIGSSELKGGIQAFELLRRPNVKLNKIRELIPDLRDISLNNNVMEEIEIMAKYEGYIAKQKHEAEAMRKIEEMKIPLNFDYLNMDGLRIEARQKLQAIQPLTIGQASRIAGVNPCDVSILILNVKRSFAHE